MELLDLYDDNGKVTGKTIVRGDKSAKVEPNEHIALATIFIENSEGKNRQVRKMCEAIGKRVQALHRSKIANIDVKNLKIGMWRYLTIDEINYLKINS